MDKGLKFNQNILIKEVQQSIDSPTILIIKGYASYDKDIFGNIQVDRDGEHVSVSGLDVTDYVKNPVIVYNHNWDTIIGKAISVQKDANGLLITAEIHKLTGYEYIFEAVQKGLLKAFSIGFLAHEVDYIDNDILSITKSSLIEISVLSVQSNQEALFGVVNAKSLASANNISIEQLKSICSKTLEKDKLMDLKEKDAQPVVPAILPEAEPKVEVQPVVPAVAPVVPEVKVEVKNDINVSELASQLVKAQVEADKIKEDAAKVAEDERLAKIEADKQAEVQKFTDVLTFIENTKNEILKLSTFDELNDRADELNKIIEPITTASEAIIAKVIELSKTVVEVKPEA